MIAAAHGTGTPLILIHGFGVDHRLMLPLERQLEGTPWRRIYLDLPWAEGAFDTGAVTPRALAHETLAEVRKIANGGPFTIVGNSFGAVLARFIAHELRQQCVGLATLTGVFVPDRGRRIVPAHEVVTADAAVLERADVLREEFESLAVVHTDAALELFRDFVLPGLRGADQDALNRLSENYADAPDAEHDSVTPFTAPALHIFGKQDRVVGYEDGLARRAHYPRGSFVVIDGAGHNAHLEQPEIVGAHLRSWLQLADLVTARA